MHEQIMGSGTSKTEKYESLINPLKELLATENDHIACMANLSSVLKETFGFFWVGFYIVKDKQLVLGPFQGSLACTRIDFGKGVCGKSWELKKPIIVKDVELYPDHIACSNLSRSEIVIPLFNEGVVWSVLDIDSDLVANFDSIDQSYLEKIVNFLNP